MKIRLEKLAVNISKLTCGKNEKSRRGGLHEKLRLDLYFVSRKQWETLNGKQNNLICDMSKRGFLIVILLHIYNVRQAEVVWVFYSLL